MATQNFTIAYSTTLESVLELTPNTTVYVEDLGNCQSCIELTQNCWACISTEQQVFSDEGLNSPVSDGYYMVLYATEDSKAVWKIVGGYPQSEGFYN
jgi:hypothetical protein